MSNATNIREQYGDTTYYRQVGGQVVYADVKATNFEPKSLVFTFSIVLRHGDGNVIEQRELTIGFTGAEAVVHRLLTMDGFPLPVTPLYQFDPQIDPYLDLTVLEKDCKVAAMQVGHNATFVALQ